jgi:hypothetical protein
MAAKAWSLQQKAVEEIFFQNDAVSLCLLVNRRARTMRVIDFRAGPSHAKRLFVHSLAEREGVEKVYTLVERDEVATWQKMGFAREGNIPGFYKRSDAFILGCPVVRGRGRPGERRHAEEIPLESETRLAVAAPAAEGPAAITAGQERMERTIAAAKRAVKDLGEKAHAHTKVSVLDEVEARKAVGVAMRGGRALTTFEPFGRDVQRSYYATTTRGFELVASTESQACFGNAYLELLASPKTEAEKAGTVAALRAICERLLAEGVVSCFSLAPSDDVALATAFIQNGFRRTGLLAEHLVVAGQRKDAILWSRKIANPTDE